MLRIVRNNQCIHNLHSILVGICVALLVPGLPGIGASISDVSSEKMSTAESPMGNLFADALRASVKTDIGLIASSEIRTKAPITAAAQKGSDEISSLVNYPEDTVTVIEITGKQLISALEQSVSSYPKPTLRFLQVSGLKFTFNPDKPQGSRVVEVTVGKTKLSNTSKYTAAVTRSLARGALGYWKVWSRTDIKAPANTPTVVDAINTYLKKDSVIDYNKLDRIIVAGPKK